MENSQSINQSKTGALSWFARAHLCNMESLVWFVISWNSRYLIDDFLISFCQNLRANDFIIKSENIGRKKKGKREYLNIKQTERLIKKLNYFFEDIFEIPRIRGGKRQTLETLISEEVQLLAKFLRNERTTFNPRIVNMN